LVAVALFMLYLGKNRAVENSQWIV